MFLRFLLFFLIFFKRFYEFSLLNIAIIALVFLYVPMIFRIFFPRFVFLSLQFPAVYARILRRRRLLFDIYIVTIAALLLKWCLQLQYFPFIGLSLLSRLRCFACRSETCAVRLFFCIRAFRIRYARFP